MKKSKLILFLLPVALLAGCAGTGTQSGTQGAASQRATAEPTGDAAITEKVKAALAADPALKDFKIGVTTEQGVVQLKGEIKTLALRRQAEAIVRNISGVKSINNQLIITG